MRTGAWSLIAAIIVLSLVPPSLRPSTGLPHDFEHAAIFMLTGFTFGIAYRVRHLCHIAGLIAFAGVIEGAQILISGRHARVSDFVVAGLSAAGGVLVGWLVTNRRQRRYAADVGDQKRKAQRVTNH
jgi:hypothetical protein